MEVIAMKLLPLSSTAVLYLILGIAGPALAQDAPERREPQAEQKDEKRQDRAQQDQAQKKDEHGQKKEEQHASKAARIPEERFRASYGRQHVFHVNHVTVVDGSPRFAYGGYNFVLVEAWPAGWSYTDDCYIDYVDGEYFLFDLLHPGVRIAITVVL
jgi:hypothetical protein